MLQALSVCFAKLMTAREIRDAPEDNTVYKAANECILLAQLSPSGVGELVCRALTGDVKFHGQYRSFAANLEYFSVLGELRIEEGQHCALQLTWPQSTFKKLFFGEDE